MQIDIDVEPDDLIITLAMEVRGRLRRGDVADPCEAIYETIEAHREQLYRDLSFLEQIFLLDCLTERYDIASNYESEQASEAPYAVDDWREAVVTGYFWHVLQAAIRAELNGD